MADTQDKLTELPDISHHRQLSKLYLDGNLIMAVPVSLSSSSCLHTLSLNGNRLSQLQHLPPCLEVLHVSLNCLTSLDGVTRCYRLREVHAGGNRLSSLRVSWRLVGSTVRCYWHSL